MASGRRRRDPLTDVSAGRADETEVPSDDAVEPGGGGDEGQEESQTSRELARLRAAVAELAEVVDELAPPSRGRERG